MKEPAFAVCRNALSLLTAVFLIVSPAFCTVLPSGADYQMDYSVVASGGGENLTGGDYFAKSSIGQSNLPAAAGLSNGGGYSNRAGFYNPPHFIYQGGLTTVFSTPSGDLQFTLPPNSIGKEFFDITVNKDPISQPLSVDPAKITNADNKMIQNEGAWSQSLSSNLSEIAIFNEQGFYTDNLPNGGVMNLSYKDEDNDGILDGSNPPVRVDSLNAWNLDEVHNSWVQVSGVSANTDSKMLTIHFDKPGVYTLMGSLDQSISKNFQVYPVPFRPNGPNAGTGPNQTGAEGSCANCGINFAGVPQSGNIEIYTLDGRLVKTIVIPGTLSFPYVVKWDVKTASGEKTASGVYIWRVVSGTNSKTGKLMVIW